MEVLRRLLGREQAVAGIEASANISPKKGPSSVDIRSNRLFQAGLNVATRVAFVAAMLIPSAAVELTQPTSVKASTEVSDQLKTNNNIGYEIKPYSEQSSNTLGRILDNDFGDVLNSEDEGRDDSEEVEVSGNSSPDGFKPETGIIGERGEIISGIINGDYGDVIGRLVEQVEEVVGVENEEIGFKPETGILGSEGEIIGDILTGEYGSGIVNRIVSIDVDSQNRVLDNAGVSEADGDILQSDRGIGSYKLSGTLSRRELIGTILAGGFGSDVRIKMFTNVDNSIKR